MALPRYVSGLQPSGDIPAGGLGALVLDSRADDQPRSRRDDCITLTTSGKFSDERVCDKVFK
jgi:hypothetical protein